MAVLISPNMNLPIPVVGNEPGPDYAIDVNSSLTLIDQHNHTPGRGALITAIALNIDADLSFNGNDATSLRSVRFQNQTTAFTLAADVGCAYELLGELMYRDAAGNNVQITNGGQIVGAPGNIAGLVPPASATYFPIPKTFVWQSNVATPANMDAGSYIFRNIVASSFGLTMSPPLLSSNYTITLPFLPGTAKVLSIDASGNMATGVAGTVDDNDLATDSVITSKILALNVTTAKIANAAITLIKMAVNSVGTAQIIDANVTRPKLEPLGEQLSASTGAFATASPTFVGVATASLTSTGRPVKIEFIWDGVSTAPGGEAFFAVGNAAVGVTNAIFRVLRGGVVVVSYQELNLQGAAPPINISVPPATFNSIDLTAPPGSNTYTAEVHVINAGDTFTAQNIKMLLYET